MSLETRFDHQMSNSYCILVGYIHKIELIKGLIKLLDDEAKLQMENEIDSLNVSVTCGILFFEILRQRS